jgi:hypothetical protein
MIKFELIIPGEGCTQENANAVVYLQGQSYVMFNKLQIKLDRVLDANKDWVGCYLDPGLSQFIHFMKRNNNMVVLAQSAKIVSTTTSEILVEDDTDDSDDEREKKLSAMRLKQAATLHRSVKHAYESIKEISCMLKSFDRKMEHEFAQDEGAKLGILEFLRKCRGAVSLNEIEYTLKLMEDESTAIIHEELDIPPPKRQRLHY